MNERSLAPFEATPDTLEALMAQVPDGAEIHLAPGRYAGPLYLGRSMDLVGPEDGQSSVVIASDTSPVVTLADPGASICRLRVELDGVADRPDRWAVAVTKSGTLVEVEVAAPGGSAVVVDTGAAALIDSLTITEAARFGLAFMIDAKGRATNVRVGSCGQIAVMMRAGANPEISGLTIEGRGLAALAFHARSAGIVSDLSTRGYDIGMRVGRGARPVIRVADLAGGISSLVFGAGAYGDLADITCEGSRYGAVRLGAGADPRIERLSVDGHSFAIFAQDGAAGTILDSELISPESISVVFTGPDTTTSFIRGHWKGGHNGLFAVGARPELQRITLSGQAAASIAARSGAVVLALGVMCEQPGVVGFAASEGGVIRASLSTVRGAKMSGALAFNAGSRLELASTDLLDSGRAGLELGEGASVVMRDGNVVGARFMGLLAKPGSHLDIADVSVADVPLGLVALFGSEVTESGLTFEGCTRDRAYESLLDIAAQVVEDTLKAGDAAMPQEHDDDEEID